jgi:uncharacterized protein YecE (DUF72 family)
MTEKTKIYIGTSGWSYPGWRGSFYPDEWPQSRWFDYYAKQFRTVEVNATFYRSFNEQTYQKWHDRAPEGFKYVLKTPKFITHRKMLMDVHEDIQNFWKKACLLKEKLGLILLQLAPRTPFDPKRLEKALSAFEDPGKVAVEFRHPRWINPETKLLLEEIKSIFCHVDSPKQKLQEWTISDTGYIRLHGRRQWYADDYSHDEIDDIHRFMQKLIDQGSKILYVFFNNDVDGCAPKNAQSLVELTDSE